MMIRTIRSTTISGFALVMNIWRMQNDNKNNQAANCNWRPAFNELASKRKIGKIRRNNLMSIIFNSTEPIGQNHLLGMAATGWGGDPSVAIRITPGANSIPGQPPPSGPKPPYWFVTDHHRISGQVAGLSCNGTMYNQPEVLSLLLQCLCVQCASKLP